MGQTISEIKIDKIVYLRKRGHSLPEIRRIVGCSNGTILKYIHDVKILPEFQEQWRNKKRTSTLRAIKQWKETNEQAKQIIKNLRFKERAIIAASLYWAEGAKKDFSLSNSDPSLIKVFVECLEDLGVKKESLLITIRIYDDLNKEEASIFWSGIVGIPKENIQNINVLRGRKKGKLKYGMCRIRVPKGARLLKLLKSLIGVIGEELNAPIVQWIEQGTPKP